MTLLIVSFIAGVLTVLAPCILPLLPVILGGAVVDSSNKRRPLVIVLALSVSVFAFTLILKGSTALIDVSPTFWSYISAAILALFGLTLIFPETWARIVLKIPGHNKPDAWLSKGSLSTNSSMSTDILIGAALGPVFTTCSPTFFVILATVLPQSFSMGIINLLAYIVGLALALLLIAHVGQRIVHRLEWAADSKGWFRRILGVLFIVLAVSIATGFDKKIQTIVLDAGFFDVTKLENSIREKLEKSSGKTPTRGLSNNPFAPVQQFTEIVNPAGFINSQPFKIADLVGKKVILIDFVDYSCINCQRTFPYMNDWYKKYKDQGLEIVAIHTPEFAFEKDIKNVSAAAERFGLKFPIVLDNDYDTWNAYKNNAWPHKYLVDISGNIVYDHVGEGAYDETEEKIVQLLNERKQVLKEPGTVIAGAPMAGYTIQSRSPETYFGAWRNEYFGNGRPFTIAASTFKIPTELVPNAFYLGGKWGVEREYIENQEVNAQLSYRFWAKNLYIVAESADSTVAEATILIDGTPITKEMSGADVKDGTLMISGSRLFEIFSAPQSGEHRIDIILKKGKIKAYTFTFG